MSTRRETSVEKFRCANMMTSQGLGEKEKEGFREKMASVVT